MKTATCIFTGLFFWNITLAETTVPSVLETLRQGHKVKSEIGPAPSGKIVTRIDGKVQPLYWAALAGPSELYKRAGFNTIHYELNYDENRTLENLFSSWDQDLLNIKNAGLYVMIFIHNSIHGRAGQGPWTFDQQWRDYVQKIVQRYKDITNLVAWTYTDEHGDAITFPTDEFHKYLRQEYRTIDALNHAWLSHYQRFDEIQLEYKSDGHGVPTAQMITPEFPFGLGPKAYDSARFKLFRTVQCCQKFEKALREVDPVTPICSPGNNLGWAATQIPLTWSIGFDFYPGSSGSDMDTHHVWMVDVGRGPNVRPAMQFLLPERWDTPKWHLDARVFRGWIVESAIHGATGLSIWPWSMLGVDNLEGQRSTNIERIDSVALTLRLLDSSGIYEMLPQPTIAVLYQPYAVGWSAFSQVYGVMATPFGESYSLFKQLKFGTKYGQVDYLHNLHMPQVNLNNYGVILAPFAVDMNPEDLKRLEKYVENGGVILADVGLGSLQAGKTVISMSDSARNLFGIKTLNLSKAKPGAFEIANQFPELFGEVEPGLTTDQLSQYPLDVEPSTAQIFLRGPGRQGMYVNQIGKGYAVFCSTLAWTSCTVQDPLLRQVHNSLFSRRAGIEYLSQDDYSHVSDYPYFACDKYEIARFSNGYVMQNRTNQHQEFILRVRGKKVRHKLIPKSVLLVRNGKMIPLGTGLWPYIY